MHARSHAELSSAGLAPVQSLLEGAMLCNDSHLHRDVGPDGREVFTPNGAPTEVALITAGLKAGLSLQVLAAAKPRVGAVPFESEHKFMVRGRA